MKLKNLKPSTEVSSIDGFHSFDESAITPAAKAALEQVGRSESGSSRRDFLKGAGVMLIGFSALAKAPNASAQSPIAPLGTVDATAVDSWIAIGADESITGYTGKVELGQ